MRKEYIDKIENVIGFLQGKNDHLARRICNDQYLPQASRFNQLEDMSWAFGTMGIHEQAKHLSTLFLEDLSDFIVECVDADFGFSRYAERLGRSANSFDELYERLNGDPSFIDTLTMSVLRTQLQNHVPRLVCFSVPFPGNLYSAFRCARYIRLHYPDTTIIMGGGFANTELRSVSDVRVFEFMDYISLDDGELPIELIIDHNFRPQDQRLDYPHLKRTFHLYQNKVVYNNDSLRRDYKHSEVGTPDYRGLPWDQYLSVIEIANPMHSLWSDGKWNKLTMAHGCYWGKCTFCDVSLDYIAQYEPIAAKILVDRMETIIEQTGNHGFHFVDEAAPPSLMKALALEILQRKLTVTWWTNIRFEKNFTEDLCHLLSASGCIAVSGGLEVASDRLLALIQKGVTVEQVAQVTASFTNAGIMVHAYLMYGYPTQTIQETIDSLEMVRQLFELGIIQSGFWHQFALTAHSPIGMNPSDYGVKPILKPITFANNDIEFEDETLVDHDQFSYGLKKSLFNYMHGTCFDYPLQDWFDFPIPKTTIPKRYISKCLEKTRLHQGNSQSIIVYLGSVPESYPISKGEMELVFHSKKETAVINLSKRKAEWLLNTLTATIEQNTSQTMKTVKASFPDEAFDSFWYGEEITCLREMGLLLTV